MDWDALRGLAERGIEIGSHTVSHPHLPLLGDVEVQRELRESRKQIEDELRRPCRFLAYPFGDEDARIRAASAAAGYEAAFGAPGPRGLERPVRAPARRRLQRRGARSPQDSPGCCGIAPLGLVELQREPRGCAGSRRRGSRRASRSASSRSPPSIFSIDGIAVEHVLDPEPVDLVVRDVDELRREPGRSSTRWARSRIRDPLLRADVEDLARRRRLVHQPAERADRVLDVAEAARLRRRRRGSRAAVRRAHARRSGGSTIPYWPLCRGPDRVEEADDHAVEAALLVVGEREELVHRLRVGVGPAPCGRRPVDAAGVLLERQLLAGGRRRPPRWRRRAPACRTGCSARARPPCPGRS